MDLERAFKTREGFHGSKGLILFSDNQVLTYQRDDNTDKFPFYMDIPGGGSELGETPFDTFQREVMEEFGLHIDKANIVYAQAYASAKDPKSVSFFLVAQLTDAKKRQIRFGSEGTYYKIMNLDDYLKDPKMIPSYRIRILDYLKYTGKKLSIL